MSQDKTNDLPFKFGETLNITQDAAQSDEVINDRYRVLDVIGKGGMGKIYRGEQIELGREVAIKVMLAPDNEVSAKRFMQEAAITASLSHPNTVRVFDFGRAGDDALFIVMEYLDGVNIKQWITTNGHFPPQQVMRLGIQLCGSLGEAHRKDLIHRDIKPGNIMLLTTPEDGLFTKLLDFGLVKNIEMSADLSQTGSILGSPMYMSPEQIHGDEVDRRCDIYSLGLTMYYMLCGKAPYKESNISGILSAQLFKTPVPLIEQNALLESCPSLNWIIETATKKKPEQRFQSVLQMKQALEIALQDGRSNLKLVNGTLFHKDVRVEGVGPTNMPKPPSLPSKIDDSQETLRPDEGVDSTIIDSQTMTIQMERNNRIVALIGISSILALGVLGWFITQSMQNTNSIVVPSPTIVQQASIALSSTPAGAEIYENGHSIGQTPQTFKLADGESKILELRLDGHQPKTVKLTNSSPEVNISLSPIKTKKMPSKASVSPQKTKPPQKIKPPPKETQHMSVDELKSDDNPFDLDK